MSSIKFHISTIGVRTTATLPIYLYDLMAIKQGFKPRTPEAHRAVRKKLQVFTDNGYSSSQGKLSQWLQEKATLSLLDWDWTNKLNYKLWKNDRQAGEKK